MLLPILIVVVAAVIAFGVWRRFTAIQWIWLLFGAAMSLVLVWLAMLAFVIGPEMRRRGPMPPERRMPAERMESRGELAAVLLGRAATSAGHGTGGRSAGAITSRPGTGGRSAGAITSRPGSGARPRPS